MTMPLVGEEREERSVVREVKTTVDVCTANWACADVVCLCVTTWVILREGSEPSVHAKESWGDTS